MNDSYKPNRQREQYSAIRRFIPRQSKKRGDSPIVKRGHHDGFTFGVQGLPVGKQLGNQSTDSPLRLQWFFEVCAREVFSEVVGSTVPGQDCEGEEGPFFVVSLLDMQGKDQIEVQGEVEMQKLLVVE